MLTCFICKKAINDPETLFSHIKESHRIKDNSPFQCTFRQCRSIFSNFSSFKRHVRRCVARIPDNEPESEPEEIIDPEMYVYSVDNDVSHFQKAMNTAALELACSLCANMNLPRCEVYKTIAVFQKTYVTKITSGM